MLNSINGTQVIKFLYSYGGRIVPRRSDGKLRYIGGFTRVLSVEKPISFSGVFIHPFLLLIVFIIIIFLDLELLR